MLCLYNGIAHAGQFIEERNLLLMAPGVGINTLMLMTFAIPENKGLICKRHGPGRPIMYPHLLSAFALCNWSPSLSSHLAGKFLLETN